MTNDNMPTPTSLSCSKAINYTALMAHDNAVDHGFYDATDMVTRYLAQQDQHELARIARRDFILGQMAKIAGEVGEAVDAIQRGLTDEQVGTELADVVIRTFDLAAYMGVEIGTLIVRKMAVNAKRPRLHGKEC